MSAMVRLAAVALLGLMVFGTGARAEIRAMPVEDISSQEIECMALNIYWEAARGNELDLRAVAHVTANRTASAGFPADICGVVTQGGESPLYSCQFQWWCDGRSDEPTDLRAWQRALGIAEEVLTGQDVDPTGGALFFHNGSVRPDWTDSLVPTVTIGDHQFYR